MSLPINPHELIGRRFSTDFRVIGITGEGPPEAVVVTLTMHGDVAQISGAELLTIIQRGFVIEVPERTP